MCSSRERGCCFGVLVRSAMAGCAHLFATLETSNHSQADMARRTGSADLPLHGGRVPGWLGQRMSTLGAVICQAIVHHYGRDEFLCRLSHPFWFQSFGAVM